MTLPSFTGPQRPVFNAPGGLVVQVPDGELRTQIQTLSQQPGMAYLSDLSQRNDVNWQPYARQESPGMLAAHMAWLVERTTRLVLLAKMPDATAESALAAFTAKLNQITQPLRQSLTYDQGREMARHRELARNTNIKVYFCDPHSPWQRGSCENTNGLLRQMLPKGTNLSIHDQEALDSMADLLNNRPRETLDWRTPIQVFKELMQVAAEKTGATIH